MLENWSEPLCDQGCEDSVNYKEFIVHDCTYASFFSVTFVSGLELLMESASARGMVNPTHLPMAPSHMSRYSRGLMLGS